MLEELDEVDVLLLKIFYSLYYVSSSDEVLSLSYKTLSGDSSSISVGMASTINGFLKGSSGVLGFIIIYVIGLLILVIDIGEPSI